MYSFTILKGLYSLKRITGENFEFVDITCYNIMYDIFNSNKQSTMPVPPFSADLYQ